MEPVIGVDIGGTTTRVCVVGPDGRMSACRRCPTPREDTDLLDWIVHQAREYLIRGGCGARFIGLAVPGIIDERRRGVGRSVNLPELEGVDLVATVQERTSLTVRIVTDADAATWGEYVQRCPPPARFGHLRLGTGVALGVIAEGRLQSLERYGTDRHLSLLMAREGSSAPYCDCGSRGCLETLASGRALSRAVASLGWRDGLLSLQERVKAGDARAVAIIEQASAAVVQVLVQLARVLRLKVLVIGGGVIALFPELFEQIERSWIFRSQGETLLGEMGLARTVLGDDAGVIGAALLARPHEESPLSGPRPPGPTIVLHRSDQLVDGFPS